jgi:integral membrane protein
VPDQLVQRFRWVAFLEGISFLVLLGVAMPLKYLADEPLAVRVVGMIHGVLFLVYGAMVGVLVQQRGWSIARATEAMILSVVPFGTFVLDRRLAREPAPAVDAPESVAEG